MSQYTPAVTNINTGQVGNLYSLALSDGTRTYGYCLRNLGGNDDRSALNESTNIADKEKLIQFSSPSIIDRDLVFYPRVSQGDFSGGALQLVFLDATKFFDSDLEIRTPGYLSLRPAWARTTLTTGLGAPAPQSVAWNGSVYTTFAGTAIYKADGTTTTAPGITAKFIDTDGNTLFAGDGVNTVVALSTTGGLSTVATAAGAFGQMWCVNQGTNGRFLYYSQASGAVSGAFDSLFKIDLAGSLPVGAGASVPTGSTRFAIIDLVAYQNGIAILAKDPGDTGFDVWYHDGANMTRIVRVNQYSPVGIEACLGDLYVSARSASDYEPPALIKISSGSFEVVARPGSPLATLTSAGIGCPRSTGQYVYFALTNPQINGVSTANYIGVYDTITGSYSHLGNFDATDNPNASQPRQIAFSGRAAVFPFVSGGSGILQYQTNSSHLPGGNTFAASGWVVSSKIDFGTLGVAKRFRRIEAHHRPLNAGESVQIEAFVDADPLAFTTALAPRPTTATVTNSTVGSGVTTLSIGQDPNDPFGSSIGRSLYFASQLHAGTGNATTPVIIYFAIEVGGTWVWEVDIDCTSRRRLLNGATEDPQGVTGKDLYYLLRNAYENGTSLTLTLADNSYSVNIESMKAQAFGYVNHQNVPVRAEEEWLVHAVLRQEAS